MKLFIFVEKIIKYFFLQKKEDNSHINEIELKILLKYFFKLIRYYSKEKYYINIKTYKIFNEIISKRRKNKPINYIIGQKEFYLKKFKINKNVLIPRNDTEFLIDVILFYIKKDNINLCDLGTGSCIISTILKLKKPTWEFNVTDISIKSLNLAYYNSKKILRNKINFFVGYWLFALPKKLYGNIDVIISNPPYVNINELKKTVKNLKYEPIISLYSKRNGLYDFSKIIYYSKRYLKKNGFLFLEHGSDQGKIIRKMLFKYKYMNIRTIKDFNHKDRVTIAINK